MARTPKNTVDYFPHYADASSGDTLTVLQSRFNNDGYAFWFKLLEKLTSTNGHYLDLRNPQRWQTFLAKMGIEEKTTVEIINLLVEMEAIDPELWQSKVIWCQNLVNNLADVYKNRRRQPPEKPITTVRNGITTERNCVVCGGSLEGLRADAKYCSDNCRLKGFRETDNETDNFQSTPDNAITTPRNPITTADNTISTDSNTQSKVKEIIVKEIKEEDSKEVSSVSSSTKDTELRKETTLEDVLELYREKVGEPSEDIENGIKEVVDKLSAAWVIDATNLAVSRNKKNWPYIAGILNNWRRWPRRESKRRTNQDPDKYIRGQYGHLVRR